MATVNIKGNLRLSMNEVVGFSATSILCNVLFFNVLYVFNLKNQMLDVRY